jgi:hypothetical protein
MAGNERRGAGQSSAGAPVVERRALRFNTWPEAIAESRRLIELGESGRLRCAGNWTLGQAIGHLGTWINYGFDGYPMTVAPELQAEAQKRKDHAFEHGLRCGYRIPNIDEGTTGIEVIPEREALEKYIRAGERLAAGTPRFGHPFFGMLSKDDWWRLHLRHAELHLSVFHPLD